MFKTSEEIAKKLAEVHDYEEVKLEEWDDARLMFSAVDFIGNDVYVKVIIDDELSMWDWGVYEQEADGIGWEEMGTVGECL